MSNLTIQGNANGTGTTTIQSANTSAITTFTWPGTDGTANQVLQTDGSGNLSFASAGTTTAALTMNSSGTGDASGTTFNGSTARTLSYNTLGAAATAAANTFTAAQTFRAANAIRSEAASTQDAVVLAGRAGGTSSHAVTLTPTTLSSSTTLTLPNVTDTVATIGTAQTFTAAQTFRAANAIRSEAASTQDAVVIAGRAGGTGSFAVTLTPTTLTASRTVTLPDANTTIPVATQVLTFSGPTAARTITLPDANFTAARTDAGQTFTGTQTVLAAATQDAVALAGRAGGSSSFVATFTPATLTASRTITIPNETFTIGFRNLPAVGTQTGSYTLGVNDVGKYVQISTGGSITIPTSTFAEGDAITLFNNTTGNITITCSAPTAYIAGANTVKTSMTLATRGVATILFYSATACVVSGNVT